jgi:NAD(P)-dependent dehydrogenase (short-subunit alcohol dehydrogenase family)
MNLTGATVVVTGGGGGIGRALVAAFVREGASAVIVHDRDAAATAPVVALYAGHACKVSAEHADVTDEQAFTQLISRVETKLGRIDVFCSNAGILIEGGPELESEGWNKTWAVNVMAHVIAARAALPHMLKRGSGHFLNVASAAGMLTAPGAAAYTTTKHAAVGFAEWLAITYGSRGIGVTVLCPETVDTAMLTASKASSNAGVRRITDTSLVLTADVVAAAALDAVKAGTFLVTPHPHTLKNTQKKWADVDRWLKGMRAFLEGPKP